jgi:hypothetical protein
MYNLVVSSSVSRPSEGFRPLSPKTPAHYEIFIKNKMPSSDEDTMGNQGGRLETLSSVLFLFLWPVYIPYAIAKWTLKTLLLTPLQVLGLDAPLRQAYARTVGWVKMKVGLWQPIGYRPAYSDPVYDYVPSWVDNAAREEIGARPPDDYTFEFTGRSFDYRVEYQLRGQKAWTTRVYRKLRTPLYPRVLNRLSPFG